MKYQRFYNWVNPQEFRWVRDSLGKRGTGMVEEARIPCRILRSSVEIGFVAPPAWDGFCKRRASWYRRSDKMGKFLVISNTPLDHLDIENPIIITESNFEPDRLPSHEEILQLIKSEKYQRLKPGAWEKVDPLDKEFYQRWFERHRPDELFDFDEIFTHHSANHANFLDPKFFINQNGIMVPYSIADTIHVCSSCLEFFNILGSQWSVKYVVPCIGAVQFAHLPMDRYFKVEIH